MSDDCQGWENIRDRGWWLDRKGTKILFVNKIVNLLPTMNLDKYTYNLKFP